LQNDMDIRDQKRFYVGDWLVTPDEDTVRRDSHTERLEPLAMQVLVYLASRAGEVVPRSDLEEVVWKGGVVSYDAVTSTVIKLRKALGDSARNSIYIVTVPKRGYQLIAPVRAVHENPQSHAPLAPSGGESRRWPIGRKPVLAVLAVAIIGGAVVAFLEPQAPGPAPTGMDLAETKANSLPSIAVLPFSNLSGDAEQAYFVDGVTEDIVTEISRLSNLRVIAWRTSSAYKNARSQPHEIGEELGVGYVLDGSVRTSGDRLRVSARLIDATTGDHLWAERFDRSLVDIFDVQEDVARRIVDALAVKLTVAEAKTIGTRGTDNFAAYEAFLRGQQLVQQRTEEGYEQARKAYEKAIAFDPDYARPYGALAILLTRNFRNDWTNLTVEEARVTWSRVL
jgi:TolB-like protein/DNA-binding winged helix-turn-helix (wHTH) protein